MRRAGDGPAEAYQVPGGVEDGSGALLPGQITQPKSPIRSVSFSDETPKTERSGLLLSMEESPGGRPLAKAQLAGGMTHALPHDSLTSGHGNRPVPRRWAGCSAARRRPA